MISNQTASPISKLQTSSAINCTGMSETGRPFNEKRARKQFRELRRRINRASKKGNHAEAERLTRMFLKSVNCMRVTALDVWKGRKHHQRPKLTELMKLADNIDLWKPCAEEVWVKYIEKEGKNQDHRPIMVFGLENRIRQVHVRNVLEPQARLLPCQYVMHGGVPAAMKALRQHYLDGYRYLVELDIANCFSNLKGEGVYKILPLAEEVTRNTVMSTNLNLHTSDITSWILGELEDEVPLEDAFQPEDLSAIRWGIPQGSCAAPLCAEMVIRDIIEKLPDLGKLVNFADTFQIACKEANAAKAILSALWTAHACHPAGLLTPGFWHIHKPGETFDFLGYTITPRNNGYLKFDLGPRSRNKIERRLQWVRGALKDDDLSSTDKAAILTNCAYYLMSLRRAFPLWRGGDYALMKLFSILEDWASDHDLEIELPTIKKKRKEFF